MSLGAVMVQNNASLWKCLKDEMLSPQKNERHVFFFLGGGWDLTLKCI